MKRNNIIRKKAAKIFICIALVVWSIPFAIDVFRQVPHLYNIDDYINDGLSELDIWSAQFDIAMTLVFVFPPAFMIGVLFICGVYHLIKGTRSRISLVIRIIYITISFSVILFLIIYNVFGGVLATKERIYMIFYTDPIVVLVDIILEIIALITGATSVYQPQ